MFDDTRLIAEASYLALLDLLEKIKQKYPTFAIQGMREAWVLISSREPDPSITKVDVRQIRVRGKRDSYIALRVSIPGYSFRLKMVPIDPAICLLNTVLVTGRSDKELLLAERRAQRKLRGHISEEQWMSYQLTSAFTEISRRSGLLYLFRRGFPTLVFKSSPEGNSFFLGLCLHAEGHEPNSWAGYLCPTDDVITALLLMRTQEQRFWGKAGHHQLHSSMLGI